jgi:sec-independent protein translocase protein TatB
MFGIGMPEMILILALALVVIGPKKLPDLAKSLGRALGEFKRATSDLKRSMEIEEISEVKSSFNELNQDINQSLKGTVKDDGSPSTAPPEANAKDQQDTEKPLSDLKKAFDGLNQETDATSQTSPINAQADDNSTDPLEPSPDGIPEENRTGSVTDERG